MFVVILQRIPYVDYLCAPTDVTLSIAVVNNSTTASFIIFENSIATFPMNSTFFMVTSQTMLKF